MELNGTHQLLVYADVNLLGDRVNTIKENSGTLLESSKHIHLEKKFGEDNVYGYFSSSEFRIEREYKDC
jgi:hypothetical protein